jgi:Domain of unknown function (DUF4124)
MMRVLTTSLIWTYSAMFSCASAQGIYSCVDAKGRKLTSDRPIADCLDREQRELSSSGRVKRIVPPSLTADERAAYEQKLQAQQEEEARLIEEKRQTRALFVRYPSQAAHDKERTQTLKGIQQVADIAHLRIKQLTADKEKIGGEVEFYKKDPSKAPARLQVRLKENQNALEEQERIIEAQKKEAQAANTRFDTELTRLKPLWTTNSPIKQQPASRAASR